MSVKSKSTSATKSAERAASRHGARRTASKPRRAGSLATTKVATVATSSAWPRLPFPLRCVWIERTNTVIRSLRRYADGPCPRMPGQGSYHNASVIVSRGPSRLAADLNGSYRTTTSTRDARWPKRCACGYRFVDTDARQTVIRRLFSYVGPYGTWLVTSINAPPGSVYDNTLAGERFGYIGPDGLSIIAVTPNGHHWSIDGRASNCTLPHDTVHRCWVRTGNPENPTGPHPLDVGKAGRTCSAGAGSIAVPGYHGFLKAGHFTAG